MNAAVCREFGKPLLIEDLVLRAPADGELRVRIRASGICHSDVASIEGAWGGRLPAVFGHEAAGVVEEVGPGVINLKPGDHVIVTLMRSCGHCDFCRRAEPFFCSSRFPLDESTPLTSCDGTPITQGMRTAAFAEQVVVHSSQVVAIADDLPLPSMALLACAVVTGYGAVVNTAAVVAGSSVVVIGAGGVGLNAIQAARIVGAIPIVAVDVSDEKLEAAREFGAGDTINARNQDVLEAVNRLTGDRGADYVVVTAGSGAAAEQGLALARRGGTVVLVGMPASGVTSRVDPGDVAHNGLRILGSKLGGARLPVDLPRLIALYRQGRLKLDELVTRCYPLTDINEAIASSARGEALRNVVVL